MKMTKTMLLGAALGLSLAGAQAGDWGNWRGPNYDGSTDAKNLPTKFSKTENVLWSVKMDGPSAATPVIWGDNVFVSSSNQEKERLSANCYDRKTGALKWSHQVAKGFRQDNRSNYASPSPVTDGQVVTFFYGGGELATYNMDGDKLWELNLQKKHGEFAFLWTFSTSPLIHDGVLYMQVLQRDTKVSGRGSDDNRSYLLALDPKTGKQLWKHYRPAKARSESLEAFSTPMPFSHNGRDEIVIVGGDCLTGHDPKTGKELWRWGTWNPGKIGHWRLVPCPVAGSGVALACAPKKSPVYGVDMKTGELLWKSEDKEVSSDVPTPLYYNGHFYVLNGQFKDKRLSCIEPRSGKVLWTGEIGSRAKIEASPTCGDGKIYFQDHNGEVFVVAADPEKFRPLHRVQFGDLSMRSHRASLALANNRVFLRSKNTLFCLGK